MLAGNPLDFLLLGRQLTSNNWIDPAHVHSCDIPRILEA